MPEKQELSEILQPWDMPRAHGRVSGGPEGLGGTGDHLPQDGHPEARHRPGLLSGPRVSLAGAVALVT